MGDLISVDINFDNGFIWRVRKPASSNNGNKLAFLSAKKTAVGQISTMLPNIPLVFLTVNFDSHPNILLAIQF